MLQFLHKILITLLSAFLVLLVLAIAIDLSDLL